KLWLWLAATCWRHAGGKVFPRSAIPANVARQNYTVFPRRYYVDTLKQCRTCQRPFIFFAREQQYWFEELGFFVDADCVHCVECRKSEQQIRQTLKRYSQAAGRGDLDDEALATLIEDAVFLFEAGVLRDEQRIRRLRNLARKRIPASPVTARIDAVIGELESRNHETT